MQADFKRLGIVSAPGTSDVAERVFNPACARLRDGSLQIYPRMVRPGNISRIGSFRAHEGTNGALVLDPCGYVMEPEAPYELRDEPGGYGCEDPRVTFVAALDLYVMAYVAFGPRGPEVAVAASDDGLAWRRLGLMHFGAGEERFADKDGAFFPEPVRSPSGVEALAFYHRPFVWEGPSPSDPERIAIGYVALDAVRADASKLCDVIETHPLRLPTAPWGCLRKGAGTPPVRVPQGWLSVIHGIDRVEPPDAAPFAVYSAGIIVHDAKHLGRIVYRSPVPLFAPVTYEEIHGAVGHVVFPTGIDRQPEAAATTFDIYYGMADAAMGRGRLTLGA